MRPLSDQPGVVPDQQVSHRPFVAIDELWLRGPGLHFVEDRAPLLKVHPVDPAGRPELLDLVGRRRTSGVPGKPAFAGLEELLRPGVIHALGNAFAPAKLGDRGFAAKAIERNADLLFRRMVLPGCPSDVADNAFRRHGRRIGFLSHLRSLAATMSQKSSLPQAASSVSQVLKRDTEHTSFED